MNCANKPRPISIVRNVQARCQAFTLTELAVVLAVLALLALTLLPALASSRTKSETVRCLGNLKQVMGAILMYTHDNHDSYPPNPDDGNTVLGHHWCGGQAGSQGMPQEFDPDILADPSNCLIISYLNTNVSLFRCTADPRKGLYQGTNSALIGTIVPAARTISMNGGVGTVCAAFIANDSHSGPPVVEVNGPWLAGADRANTHNNPWRTYDKITDMVIPSPAKLFVITEESPLSINDACLGLSAGEPLWVDWPSTLHDGGCVLTFADGHAEFHKWTYGFLPTVTVHLTTTTVKDTDFWWLWQHATANFVTGAGIGN